MASDLSAIVAAVRHDGRQRMATCPAHDDRKASVSVGLGEHGRIVFTCHAGCPRDVVLNAAGLTWADLFSQTRAEKATPRIATTYDYTDEAGRLLYQVVREYPKGFKQRRPDGAGGWIWSLGDVRRVLFGLPTLTGQMTVVLPEGERDVLSLRALGMVATCNAGGAGKWRAEYTKQLVASGCMRVIVLPDNDEPGRRHAEQVAACCRSAGLAAQVVVLPSLPPHGDVSDWLAAGNTKDELQALFTDALHKATNNTDSLSLTSIGDLLSEPDEGAQWLVEERIPTGGTVIFAAKPKVGKSTAARHLALAIARGDLWLGYRCHAGAVWYFAFEGRRRDIRDHFRQLGAHSSDPIRVFVGQAPADVIGRVRQLAEAERPAAIIIDTLQRFLRAESTDDYAQMTKLLDIVIGITQRSGATIILLHHSSKADRAGIDTVLGSTAITGSVDTIVLLTRTERFRTISTVQRIGDDLPETLILLDEDTKRVRLGGSRQDAERQVVADAIVRAISGAAGPLSEPQIAELVGARTTLQRRALRDLVAQEQVLRVGRGSKGDPYRYGAIRSCSLVPPNGWEQESNKQESSGSLTKSDRDSCSRVPTRKVVPEDEPELASGDCPICARATCQDLAACLRRQHQTFVDLEDVFGLLEDIRVERIQ